MRAWTCRIVRAKVLLFRVSSYKCASEGRGGDYCPRALGETSSRSHDRSVRALARKRQITARLRKRLPLQGSSLPSRAQVFGTHNLSPRLAQGLKSLSRD